jgi:hypothetical protein
VIIKFEFFKSCFFNPDMFNVTVKKAPTCHFNFAKCIFMWCKWHIIKNVYKKHKRKTYRPSVTRKHFIFNGLLRPIYWICNKCLLSFSDKSKQSSCFLSKIKKRYWKFSNCYRIKHVNTYHFRNTKAFCFNINNITLTENTLLPQILTLAVAVRQF